MKSNSINIREQNTYIDENESLGFVADTTIKILCITAYPGVLAADIVKKFPRVISGIMAFCLLGKSSALKISSNNQNAISHHSQSPEAPLNILPLCNQIKPKENDLHKVRLHSQCLLTYAKQANPERVIEHKLSDDVLKNINSMSTIIPAVSVLGHLNEIKDENRMDHLLQFVLGVPGVHESHHEVSNLCGLSEMFDITTQVKDVLSLFSQDIRQLTQDKELTQPMVEHFQTVFLDIYRQKVPSNLWEGIKLGFNSFWNGGPTESALLLKALEDIEQGRDKISWSPQTIHALTLLSHAWETAINLMLPEKSALDSIITLGQSIKKSRATFCDYVRTAAAVSMAISAHAFPRNEESNLGRIHSVEQIRKNSYKLNELLHKHHASRAIPKSELITSDLETSLKDALKETGDVLFENDIENNHVRMRCKRAGVKCYSFRRSSMRHREDHSLRTNNSRHRNRQHDEILSADAGWSAFKDEPKRFLHENSLVSGYFEQDKPSYLNRISNGKYQVSTTELSDSIKINVEYIDVKKETGLDFSDIQGVDVDELQQDVIATPLLTGCTMLLQRKNGHRYLSHIQPVSEANPNQHLDLQKKLRQSGYETYGPEDYHGSPARFWGIKQDGRWSFFIQQQVDGKLVVKDVFKTRF